MARHYYTAESLSAEVREFERRYGTSTEVMREAVRRGNPPAGLSYFDAAVWDDAAEEAARLSAE